MYKTTFKLILCVLCFGSLIQSCQQNKPSTNSYSGINIDSITVTEIFHADSSSSEYYYNAKDTNCIKIIHYYRNNKKKKEINLLNKQIHGQVVSWYDNGQIEVLSNYFDGKRDGITLIWNRNGRLELLDYYRYDTLVNSERYYSQ